MVDAGPRLRSELHDALAAVCEECQSDNWDGYGARAVSAEAQREAARFCAMLPESAPLPEVGADPDGEIAFEWRGGEHYALSVSVSPEHKLVYAGIFGENRVHGVERFGDALPEAILSNLRRLSNRG